MVNLHLRRTAGQFLLLHIGFTIENEDSQFVLLSMRMKLSPLSNMGDSL